jgi:ArsR family transcriptional regulator, virulence genes transcriptional regulator
MASHDPLRRLAEKQADFCRIFANPTRIMILWTLGAQEKTVSEIAESIDASLSNTSQHLRIMKQSAVVASRRDAQMIYYRICDTALTKCGPMLQAPLRVPRRDEERERCDGSPRSSGELLGLRTMQPSTLAPEGRVPAHKSV